MLSSFPKDWTRYRVIPRDAMPDAYCISVNLGNSTMLKSEDSCIILLLGHASGWIRRLFLGIRCDTMLSSFPKDWTRYRVIPRNAVPDAWCISLNLWYMTMVKSEDYRIVLLLGYVSGWIRRFFLSIWCDTMLSSLSKEWTRNWVIQRNTMPDVCCISVNLGNLTLVKSEDYYNVALLGHASGWTRRFFLGIRCDTMLSSFPKEWTRYWVIPRNAMPDANYISVNLGNSSMLKSED